MSSVTKFRLKLLPTLGLGVVGGFEKRPPGTAAQLKTDDEVNNKKPNSNSSAGTKAAMLLQMKLQGHAPITPKPMLYVANQTLQIIFQNIKQLKMNIEIVKETKTLQTEVFEAMGETSMCCEPIPTGIFQSTNSERIGRELMLKIESDIPNAVGALIKALSEDKSEGSYYYLWQANIAMAFKDEWEHHDVEGYCKKEHLHMVANQAAKNFLDMLCHKVEVEATNSGVAE